MSGVGRVAAPVVDAFIFNGELELLAFRIAYLSPVVDRFVVVEADRTFRGEARPLILASDPTLREKYPQLEVHVASLPENEADAWERERLQRQALRKAIGDVEPETLVLVGDVDEVPTAEVIAELRREPLATPVRLGMRYALQYANHEKRIPWLDGTKACSGAQLDDVTEMGLLIGHPDGRYRPGEDRRIDGAGWHFSSLGGPARVSKKFGEFSHAELDTPGIRNQMRLARSLELGVDARDGTILTVRGGGELDVLQRRLLKAAPHLFSFGDPGGRLWRRLWGTYVWGIARGWVTESRAMRAEKRGAVGIGASAIAVAGARLARHAASRLIRGR